MRIYSWLLGILFVLASCAPRQPAITLFPPAVAPVQTEQCAAVYPHGKWQFVHLITFFMPGGRQGTAIGVSVIDKGAIRAALMTVEGFTLFAASFDGRLKITRAVPPFDKPGFGRRLMRDLRLIFLSPPGDNVQYGKLADGSALCRYREVSGQSTDIILLPARRWEIKQYNSKHREIRTIEAWPQEYGMRRISGNHKLVKQWRPPKRMELQARGSVSYRLKMELISSQKL
ncbi:hypothetical protein ACOHYD_04170 [Desulfobacterota bacterium M19]